MGIWSTFSTLCPLQVSISRDGKLVGFQPLNEVAISCWASMPFTRSLHNIRQYKPGFWERPLRYRSPPSDVVVFELGMDLLSKYAYVRPFPM
ncbi:hypothetical protein KP509_1Z256600 [Ceratopteris richardii]|nr:hypothetical protein KP509_1Z256600 [Ceratopteris richardii]